MIVVVGRWKMKVNVFGKLWCRRVEARCRYGKNIKVRKWWNNKMRIFGTFFAKIFGRYDEMV